MAKTIVDVDPSILTLYKQNNLDPEETIKKYMAIFDHKQFQSGALQQT